MEKTEDAVGGGERLVYTRPSTEPLTQEQLAYAAAGLWPMREISVQEFKDMFDCREGA